MNSLKSYKKFISLYNEIPKIQIVLRGNIGLTSKTEYFTIELMKILYDKFIHMVLVKGDNEYNRKKGLPINRLNIINWNLPILNFTSRKHNVLKNTTIYNKLEDYSIAASKVEFAKTFAKEYFIPKTIFNINDIESLSLPIIAKPTNGFSAQGIEVFKTYEDAKKSKLKFNLWSEKKSIVREFRIFILNKEIIHISERVNNVNNDKSVDVKKPDEKIDFIYIDQNLKSFPMLSELEKIKDILLQHVNLDFWNIDLMVDEDNKLWIPEINGAPGIGPSMFYNIYKKYIKMAHNIELTSNVEEELQTIVQIHRSQMLLKYPKEHQKSLHPILK